MAEENQGQTGEPVKADTQRKHFEKHRAGVVDAARAIQGTAAALKKTNKVDEREQLHRDLDQHVSQLVLAANNAVTEPAEIRENTGGAASEGPLDPDAHLD
jgi:preprotein translocase subunit SecA